MINTVRATVLSIANKNNFGYITPGDFNLYAKQAQLDIFEDYFYQYNNQVVKQNARVSGSGYADILKGIESVVDSFSSRKSLLNKASNTSQFQLPHDYYLMSNVNYCSVFVTSGSSTSIADDKIVDVNANFYNKGVKPGMLVCNATNPIDTSISSTGESAYVISVDSQNQLTLSNSVNTIQNQGYTITKPTLLNNREIERVSMNKIFLLNETMLTTPTTTYPAYTLSGATSKSMGNTINIYPDFINKEGTVIADYIRYPRPPKWTYFNIISGGEPTFDETASDYQDFELPDSDQTNLVNKILQYAGMSIREIQLTQFAKNEEIESDKQEG